MTKGFITIAVGEYYKYLAIYLVKTYRLNGGKQYPFAVVTDKPDNALSNHFDHVILEEDKLEDGYLYKLKLPEYTPFEQTIFVDADCFVVKAIDWYWDFFSDTNFGVFGRNTHIDDKEAVTIFDKGIAMKEFNIQFVPRFNGGIYYYLKKPESKKIFDDASAFVKSYDYFGMPRFTNIKTGFQKMGDEPLFALAMAKNQIKAQDCPASNGMWNINGSKNMSINLLKRKCSYQKYGGLVHPSIVHFGTDNTKRFHYKKEVLRLQFLNKKNILWYQDIILGLYKFSYITKVQIARMLFFRFFDFKDVTPTSDKSLNKIRRGIIKLKKALKITK